MQDHAHHDRTRIPCDRVAALRTDKFPRRREVGNAVIVGIERKGERPDTGIG
ncbi:MAG TPA: hypothetical protein VEI81_05625 [Methanoregula sp.]|nr:hypothetical protein [Methanoregula sp.]